jgi:3-dehydroquinate dehydratase-1
MITSQAELEALDITTYQGADIIEWRADFVPIAEIAQLAPYVQSSFEDFELLFTYRTEDKSPIDADAYRNLVTHVTGFDYVDVEVMTYGDLNVQAKKVASYHEFSQPSDPKRVLARLNESNADVIKYAMMPENQRQIEALLQAARDLQTTKTLAVMAMGPLGRQTRLPNDTNPSDWIFTYVGQASAPGQIALQELLEMTHD